MGCSDWPNHCCGCVEKEQLNFLFFKFESEVISWGFLVNSFCFIRKFPFKHKWQDILVLTGKLLICRNRAFVLLIIIDLKLQFKACCTILARPEINRCRNWVAEAVIETSRDTEQHHKVSWSNGLSGLCDVMLTYQSRIFQWDLSPLLCVNLGQSFEMIICLMFSQSSPPSPGTCCEICSCFIFFDSSHSDCDVVAVCGDRDRFFTEISLFKGSI